MDESQLADQPDVVQEAEDLLGNERQREGLSADTSHGFGTIQKSE
jgi:hypothetical protein